MSFGMKRLSAVLKSSAGRLAQHLAALIINIKFSDEAVILAALLENV